MPNRHDRRKAPKAPRVMKIVVGAHEMTFTPATIERIWKEWEAANPGKKAHRDMPKKDFADRCMQALYESARPMQTGTA